MLISIDCPVQQYKWGKLGLNSKVAQLHKLAGGIVDQNQPYAELWVGTHVNGPATLTDGTLLSNWLSANPQFIHTGDTDEILNFSDGNLPYLFKILSVGTALSIQSHPDKKLAERLHKENPSVYKDPNHKPEMACAITEFEALCGFRAVDEILGFIDQVPELRDLIYATDPKAKDVKASSDKEEQRHNMKILFSALMFAPKPLVAEKFKEFMSRVGNSELRNQMPHSLAYRLGGQYDNDVGIFCVYMLAYHTLQPGEALFLGANEPHAYISGDCAEIMACSDNVIRAGLTPKLCDTEALCSSLTYNTFGSSDDDAFNVMTGDVVDAHCKLYAPPDPAVFEFQLEHILVKKGDKYTMRTPSFACVLLVLEGSGVAIFNEGQGDHSLVAGKEYFQSAGSSVTVKADEDMIIFRASLKGST